MSKIRSKNTKAELIAFAYLRKQHLYFQKHYSRAVGKPDIAKPRQKKAVFIDSEFWHGKDYERITSSRPKDDYWVKKIGANIKRDIEQRAELKNDGWKLLVVWERDIIRLRTREQTLKLIKDFLLQSN